MMSRWKLYWYNKSGLSFFNFQLFYLQKFPGKDIECGLAAVIHIKAELLQLNRTQYPSLEIFMNCPISFIGKPLSHVAGASIQSFFRIFSYCTILRQRRSENSFLQGLNYWNFYQWEPFKDYATRCSEPIFRAGGGSGDWWAGGQSPHTPVPQMFANLEPVLSKYFILLLLPFPPPWYGQEPPRA